MKVTDESAARTPPQVARRRPAVERLLSLSGAIPLPVFLALHLTREAVLSGASEVADAVRPAPSVFGSVTALCLVWTPLAVHVALGAWLLVSRRSLAPPASLPDVPSAALRLSRASSVLALAFVGYHAGELPLAVWLGSLDASDTGFRLLARLSSTSAGVPLHAGAYLVGLLATSAHAGLALYRALLAEELVSSAAGRRACARLCTGGAVLSFALGALSVIRVATGGLLR